ncbi:MAG: ATP-binding protein [Candidatus Omnitrophica bacterium]|nr:ATP-binding protein [Candidatus Omnitrophota bacterium]
MKKRIGNDSQMVKKLGQSLAEELKERGVSEEVVFDIYVGFEEALRNAIVHGNKQDPDKMVTVETDIQDEKVIITIEDEGEGFDPASLPDPTLDENLLKESGRGVYLINHLMDEVTYQRGGKKVRMVKYFEKNTCK